jgi:hypothetical protein
MNTENRKLDAATVTGAAQHPEEDGHALTLHDVRRLVINAGETLVIKTTNELNDMQRKNVVDVCAKVLPEGVNIMLLGPDWDMHVVSKETANEPAAE